MKIFLKNPAPKREGDTRWGDDYFGRSLASALEREGCIVEQEFWPEWVAEPQDGVVIVLRGLRAWKPPKAGFRILWIMSHPTQVTAEEVAGYDLILVASKLHAKLLAESTSIPVELAMQCTDHQLFFPSQSSIEEQVLTREGIVYVANTRGIRRDMGQFLGETGQAAKIYGRGWQSYSLENFVREEHIHNSALPEIYRAARIGLNDHWLDMRALGYVNNRLLDTLACGLPTITDDVPEVRQLFGDALIYAGTASEFSEALQYSETHYAALLERVDRLWKAVGADYTFATRAAEIVQWIKNPPSGGRLKVFDGAGTLGSAVASSLVATVHHEEQRTAFFEEERKKIVRQLEATKSELSTAATEAKQSKKRLAKTQEQLHHVEGERDKLLKQLRDAEQQVSDWTLSAVSWQDKASGLQGDVKQLKQRLKKAHDAKANALQKQQLAEVQTETARLRAKVYREHVEAVTSYSDHLERQLESVLLSTSWRVTGAMRAIAKGVYSAIGKGRPQPVALAELPQRPAATNVVVDSAAQGATTATQATEDHNQAEDLVDYWRAQAYALLQELEAVTLRCMTTTEEDTRERAEPVVWHPPGGE